MHGTKGTPKVSLTKKTYRRRSAVKLVRLEVAQS